jgi:hypothetical protein
LACLFLGGEKTVENDFVRLTPLNSALRASNSNGVLTAHSLIFFSLFFLTPRHRHANTKITLAGKVAFLKSDN